MIRFILFLLLFFIIFSVARLLIKFLSSPSKTSIHNAKVSQKNKNKYENIEDAEFTEIKSEGEKKNNN